MCTRLGNDVRYLLSGALWTPLGDALQWSEVAEGIVGADGVVDTFPAGGEAAGS